MYVVEKVQQLCVTLVKGCWMLHECNNSCKKCLYVAWFNKTLNCSHCVIWHIRSVL